MVTGFSQKGSLPALSQSVNWIGANKLKSLTDSKAQSALSIFLIPQQAQVIIGAPGIDNEEGDWKDYYLHKAFCVFEHNGDFHWLHDEFIDIFSDGTVWVDCCQDCFACLKKNEHPPFSMSRVNYGSARWIGLKPLTILILSMMV